MRDITTTPALILLATITLFVLAPQLGSLDVDSDGVPDVPVIVLQVNSQSPQAKRCDRQPEVATETASPFLTLKRDGKVEARIVDEPSGSRLNSVALLRC